MTWLRISDGFTSNSKIAQLTDGQFRVWMRLLCHCAASRDPSVDRVAIREVSGLTSHRIRAYFLLGLLDKIGSEYEIHDWTKFLPREEQNAARQAKWRARHRNAGRNAVSNDDSSRARAGTRGSPSRPVPKEQEQTPTQPNPLARTPAKNGLGGEDHEQIREQIKTSLAAASTPDDDIPF